MDDKEYLGKILDHDGGCSNWADEKLCENCPLSKLVRRSSGGYLSCTEAVKATGLNDDAARLRYVAIAALLLLDINIEDILLDL